jgi:hypothetical protein
MTTETKWIVGVTIQQGPQREKVTLWTLDNITTDIKLFDTKEDADVFGERCWPNQWTTKEVSVGPDGIVQEEEANS